MDTDVDKSKVKVNVGLKVERKFLGQARRPAPKTLFLAD
jgi:hypothetical protein